MSSTICELSVAFMHIVCYTLSEVINMFGEKIRELRLRNGWTQQEVADKVGLKKSMISMLERNERKPSFEVLEAFADVFNVDLDMLAGDKRSQVDELRDMLKENHNLRMLLSASAKLDEKDIEQLIRLAKLMDKE